MKSRVVTGIIILLIAFPVVILSQYPGVDMLFTIVSVLGTYEMMKCLGFKEKKALIIPAIFCAFTVPLICRFDYLTGFGVFNESETNVVITLLLLLMFVFFTAAVFSRGQIDIIEAGFASVMCIYIIGGCYAALYVTMTSHGQIIFPLIFVTSWVTDACAYFTGSLIGKHKLVPYVSPNKTVEGSVGGIVFCAAAFALYGFIVSLLVDGMSPRYFLLCVVAVVLSVISQLGDLLMSVVKRRKNIKDFGTIFGSHGGILDRFDSTIAISFVICLLCATGRLVMLFK